MNDSVQTLFVLGIVVLVIVSMGWSYSRSRSVLEKWADENGYAILHSEYRTFWKGPFFWTSSRGQTVYYVTVRDRGGRERTGWVRCGGWFLGLLSERAEVGWDREW